jgi:hypothetical protein
MKKNKLSVTVAFPILILALSSISCGVSGLSSLLATETPTPTSTFTPTIIPSPTSTSIPTSTPTVEPLPTGASAEEQADGSTLFIDYDNQYQLTIPENWLVLPLSSEDIVDILEKVAEENPDFEEIAKTFAQLDPDVIRVIALNQDFKYTTEGFSTNLTITAIEDNLMSSMPLDFVTGAMEESLKQQGATVVSESQPAYQNANGVEIGSFEFQQEAPTVTGARVKIQSKILVFQSNGKLLMVQLAVPQQFVDELIPALDQIANTIELIVP